MFIPFLRRHVYFIKIYLFIYLWLCWVFVPVHGLSLVVASRGYHLAVVRGRLIAVASLVAEHRLWSTQASVFGVHRLRSLAPGLWSAASVVLTHRVTCTSGPCLDKRTLNHWTSKKTQHLHSFSQFT